MKMQRGTVTERRRVRKRLLLAVCALHAASALAEGWPTYRHDIARSGVTPEPLSASLSECWVFEPRRPPEPAWSDPNPRPVGGWHGLVEYRRVHFDDAFHVAVADGKVFFGSSADNKVYALDAATGKVAWTTFTGGPVRLAPTVHGGRVYVGSDDGFANCLRGSDGEVIWRFRAAPSDRRVLGSGKMISLWPLRTGVLVDDGAAYFGAGIFPAEGVYMYAVGAGDGKLMWRNDTCGEDPRSRFSPQGYLLATENALFAPTGRVSPSAFGREHGRLLHQSYIDHRIGGGYALIADGHLFTGTKEMMAYKLDSPRDRVAWFQGRKLVVKDTIYYAVSEREMTATDSRGYSPASLKRRGLLGKMRNPERDFRRAKGERGRREADVKATAAKIADIEKRLAEVEGTPQPDEARGAALKAERDALKKAHGEQQKALAEATGRLAKAEARLKPLKEKLTPIDTTIKSAVRWRVPCDCYESLILAGNTLFAGGKDKVVAVDAGTGDTLWTGRVNGKARGLAAAEGCLFVSTDTGAIHCFGPAGSKRIGPVREPTAPSPYPRDRLTPVFESAAEGIVRTTGVTKGYCLVLGCGTGRLAFELAKRTDLRIYGVDPVRENVEAARKALDKAGLYGTRVCVERGDLSRVPYSDYFANLIVSETALVSGEAPGDAGEMFRMLKPAGGVALIGQPAEARDKVKALTRDALRRWLAAAEIDDWRATTGDGLWARVERGPLKGAGKWTHQYAEPGNSACGDDEIVKCPLGVLWFGEPGPGKMVERHRKAAAPLSLDGRLFVQGLDVVMAYDAYNGLKLWERGIPGATRAGVSHECGNLALSDDSLFVAVNDKCLRLDPATGDTTDTFDLPPSPGGERRRWGYVATLGGLLFGSSTKAGRTCDRIFAVDLRTGKLRWIHKGSSISHITIAISDGKVFFADAAVTPGQRQAVLMEKLEGLRKLKGRAFDEARKRVDAADVRLVVALDAETGRARWQKPMELTDCRRISRGGGELIAMCRDNVLVFCAASVNGHFWGQFFGGEFARRTVVALSGRDGSTLWAKAIGYRHRPLIVGDTLVAEPWAFDLRTGRLKMRKSPITGEESPWQFARPGHHCGSVSACPSTLFFRSLTMAYYDLIGDFGTQHFGSIRPGCWINMIPANGLVLVPESSSGCMCPFPNMCTVVFQPREESRSWAMYSDFRYGKQHKSWAEQKMAKSVKRSPGPVRHLALNLGAPGDRKGSDGTLWLGYPRPRERLVYEYKMAAHVLPGGGYYKRDPFGTRIEGTETPWVYTSGCRGMTRCALPLVGDGQTPGLYTVRLGFVEPDNDRPGQRLFNVMLQGKVVLESFDVLAEAGGRDRAVVKEFVGVQVDRELTIEFVPKAADPSSATMPVLNSIEVLRTKTISIRLIPPSFLLSDYKRVQTQEFNVRNLSDERFVGRLSAGSVASITAEPGSLQLALEPGEEKAVALTVTAAKGTKAGEYRIPLRLLGRGGQVESENAAVVKHLGNKGRVTLVAAEDTYVKKGTPKRNFGGDQKLWVDGGAKEMGDGDHGPIYLKFRLDVPGKPLSATVRLHVGTWNAAQSGDSGVIRLVKGAWDEMLLTYETRPELGEELAKIGRTGKGGVVERAIPIPLKGRQEVSIALTPTSCDGGGYCSRETAKPAELVVEFGPAPEEDGP